MVLLSGTPSDSFSADHSRLDLRPHSDDDLGLFHVGKVIENIRIDRLMTIG